MFDIVEIFKALGDTNRLRILNLLEEGPLCVCDLEEVLKLNQSNLSRHLAKLKQTGLVNAQKKGLFIYYSRRELAAPYNEVINRLYEGLRLSGEWQADLEELATRVSCEPSTLKNTPLE